MVRLKLWFDIGYDGTNFSGWQAQEAAHGTKIISKPARTTEQAKILNASSGGHQPVYDGREQAVVLASEKSTKGGSSPPIFCRTPTGGKSAAESEAETTCPPRSEEPETERSVVFTPQQPELPSTEDSLLSKNSLDVHRVCLPHNRRKGCWRGEKCLRVHECSRCGSREHAAWEQVCSGRAGFLEGENCAGAAVPAAAFAGVGIKSDTTCLSVAELPAVQPVVDKWIRDAVLRVFAATNEVDEDHDPPRRTGDNNHSTRAEQEMKMTGGVEVTMMTGSSCTSTTRSSTMKTSPLRSLSGVCGTSRTDKGVHARSHWCYANIHGGFSASCPKDLDLEDERKLLFLYAELRRTAKHQPHWINRVPFIGGCKSTAAEALAFGLNTDDRGEEVLGASRGAPGTSPGRECLLPLVPVAKDLLDSNLLSPSETTTTSAQEIYTPADFGAKEYRYFIQRKRPGAPGICSGTAGRSSTPSFTCPINLEEEVELLQTDFTKQLHRGCWQMHEKDFDRISLDKINQEIATNLLGKRDWTLFSSRCEKKNCVRNMVSITVLELRKDSKNENSGGAAAAYEVVHDGQRYEDPYLMISNKPGEVEVEEREDVEGPAPRKEPCGGHFRREVENASAFLEFRFVADGFLRHMVRRLVGHLVAVGMQVGEDKEGNNKPADLCSSPPANDDPATLCAATCSTHSQQAMHSTPPSTEQEQPGKSSSSVETGKRRNTEDGGPGFIHKARRAPPQGLWLWGLAEI
ncbi:unnamed protein product [Amoebophrya sp. A120]|nr:unnamed protein product [Amoebophrya sp. A120]|eukprot:GSA120T00000484001.1